MSDLHLLWFFDTCLCYQDTTSSQGRTRFLRLLSFDDKALDKLCELAKFGSSHYDTHIDPWAIF